MEIGDPLLRNPITGMAGCCARAASGHVAAAKRDEIASLHVPLRTSVALCDWAASEKWHAIGRPDLSKPNVRFGSKADMCSAQADVCFMPIADMTTTSRRPSLRIK